MSSWQWMVSWQFMTHHMTCNTLIVSCTLPPIMSLYNFAHNLSYRLLNIIPSTLHVKHLHEQSVCLFQPSVKSAFLTANAPFSAKMKVMKRELESLDLMLLNWSVSKVVLSLKKPEVDILLLLLKGVCVERLLHAGGWIWKTNSDKYRTSNQGAAPCCQTCLVITGDKPANADWEYQSHGKGL